MGGAVAYWHELRYGWSPGSLRPMATTPITYQSPISTGALPSEGAVIVGYDSADDSEAQR